MGVEERWEKSYRWNNRSWLNNAKILIPFSENVTFSLLWILHIFIPIWQGTKCRRCSVLNRQKYPKKLLPVGQHVISNRLKIDQLIIIHYTSPPGPHGVQTKSFVSRPQIWSHCQFSNVNLSSFVPSPKHFKQNYLKRSYHWKTSKARL